MRDPVVVVACGHTFDRAPIAEWLRAHRTCPVCRAAADRVTPNRALKALIDEFIARRPAAEREVPAPLVPAPVVAVEPAPAAAPVPMPVAMVLRAGRRAAPPPEAPAAARVAAMLALMRQRAVQRAVNADAVFAIAPARARHHGRRCVDGSLDMRCRENFGCDKFRD